MFTFPVLFFQTLTEVYKHFAIALSHVLRQGQYTGYVVVQNGVLLLKIKFRKHFKVCKVNKVKLHLYKVPTALSNKTHDNKLNNIMIHVINNTNN